MAWKELFLINFSFSCIVFLLGEIIQPRVGHADLCLSVTFRVVLNVERVLRGGHTGRGAQRTDVGVLLVDGWCSYHGLAVVPLEITQTWRRTLIQSSATWPQAQRPRQSQNVASCWTGRRVLVKHAAALSSCLATRQPSQLTVVQSGDTPWQKASTWECLASWSLAVACWHQLMSVLHDASGRQLLLLALWPLPNLVVVRFQGGASLQTCCGKGNLNIRHVRGIKAIARNQWRQNVRYTGCYIAWLFNRAL